MRYLTLLLAMSAAITLTNCSSLNKKNQKIDSKDKNQKEGNLAPVLTMPKVRKVWVPDKIESDKYIEGHWVWILERTSTWSQ